MDSIRHAVDLARAAGSGFRDAAGIAGSLLDNRKGSLDGPITEVRLDQSRLGANRIVSHGATGPSGRYYDMLRTQVLQEMDKKSWQFLAVTSPTAACGKTVTACNLALSIARLPERSVLLVDADLHKPMVGEYLGIGGNPGLLGVLEGRATLTSAVLQANLGPNKIFVLPGTGVSSGASEWMASQTMSALLQAIKRDFRSRLVIFDLPPMLIGDDVISILPQMDAVLLVAGVGATSVSDIKECQRHLQRTPVVRMVVNKVADAPDSYYGYY